VTGVVETQTKLLLRRLNSGAIAALSLGNAILDNHNELEKRTGHS
jgi:hypothetical protein